MNQGQCAFSGLTVPRGSGIYKVGVDGKVVFVWGKRELNCLKRKVSPRDVKWTETSRTFFNKTHAAKVAKPEFVPITKIVRGFASIPSALVSEKSIKPATKSTAGQKEQKVGKHSNVSVSRK